MRKPRVLLVSEYFPPQQYGGGEISAESLADTLAEKGISITVLTTQQTVVSKREEKPYPVLRKLKSGNPQTLWGNMKRKFWFQRSLKRELQKLKSYDVIHFLNTTSIPSFKIDVKTFATINSYSNFCPKANLFYKEEDVCYGCHPLKFLQCMMHSTRAGKVHMKWYLKYNPLFLFMLYFSYMKNNQALHSIDGYFSISDFITQRLLDNGIREEIITKVYNISHINETAREYPLVGSGVLVSYIGALERIKGVEQVIRAFTKITGATLLIFGEGSDRKRLEKIAGNNIIFKGKVAYENIPSIYKQSSLIVIPGLWPEPFPRTILESTYFGKPIVASDVGGNSEGVDDGKNGYLIRNEGEWHKRLQELIDDATKRKRMGKRSKEIYKKRFSTEKQIAKIITDYEK